MIDIVCIIVTTDVTHVAMCGEHTLRLMHVDVLRRWAALLIPRHALTSWVQGSRNALRFMVRLAARSAFTPCICTQA